MWKWFALCATLVGSIAPLRAGSSRVLEVDVNSVIEPVTVEIVSRAIQKAETDHDALLIIRLDTPGGLMASMREIISRIEAAPLPVATLVAPSGGRAASAGFFILEAGDLAAMALGTNTGAAHPVSISGGQIDPVMKQKIENDAAAAMRAITAARGRNTDLAQTAILESKSFTEREALDSHLIDLIVRDEQDLIRQLDQRTLRRFHGESITLHLADAALSHFEPTLRERTLVLISDPNVALILLALGGLGIYTEFSAPGMVLPGVAGAISAILGLSALSVLPIGALGVSLLILAAVFFLLEFMFTSHGVLGTGGAIALLLGSLFLIDSPLPELRIRPLTAFTVALPFALITAFLITIAARARRDKRLPGPQMILGEIGVALEDLAPTGRILTRGEYWAACSITPIKTGERVRVTGIEGLELRVDKI